MKTVTLVEKRVINKSDNVYAAVDATSFATKNLYNLVNYHIRQAYFQEKPHYLKMKELLSIIKPTDAYCALPRKVSNQVILHVYHDWGAYYKAVAVWRVAPEKFKARPGIPHYLPKADSRTLITYEKSQIIVKVRYYQPIWTGFTNQNR